MIVYGMFHKQVRQPRCLARLLMTSINATSCAMTSCASTLLSSVSSSQSPLSICATSFRHCFTQGSMFFLQSPRACVLGGAPLQQRLHRDCALFPVVVCRSLRLERQAPVLRHDRHAAAARQSFVSVSLSLVYLVPYTCTVSLNKHNRMVFLADLITRWRSSRPISAQLLTLTDLPRPAGHRTTSQR